MPVKRIARKVNGWKLIVMALLAGLLLVFTLFTRAHQTENANRKLCESTEAVKTIVRHDKQRSLAQSLEYLRDHPNGTTEIPRSLIVRGIASTRQTLKELTSVDCSKL